MNFLVLLVTFNLGDDTLPDSTHMLLLDRNVQIDATQAVNDLYNFQFEKAEQQFRWLKQKYGWHPLPYFLHGLSQWWKITPNVENTQHDEAFYAYMDTSIFLSQRLFELNNNNVEAAFFLAASYGFKGRLLSERGNWRKAASAGKNALKFLDVSKGNEDFSPELLFGDALYNYYSVWIPENYPILKPILMFFPKGDKELGIEQLREVANNAFYTRTEAQFFLMRILSAEEGDNMGALQISEYLASTFPGNPYFQRYYARLLYSTGRLRKAHTMSMDIINKIDQGETGYEQVSGRYAAFFLGQINQAFGKMKESKHYYGRAVTFSEEIEAFESGYYHHSLLNLGRIAAKEGDPARAREYFKSVKKYAKKKSSAYQRSKEEIKQLKQKGKQSSRA